jgi:hypothetical protein
MQVDPTHPEYDVGLAARLRGAGSVFRHGSQPGGLRKICARTIGPSVFWAASPKNTRNGRIRSKSVKTGKPPLRHVSSAAPPPIGYRQLLLLGGCARQRPARAAKPREKRCKKVQKGAKKCNRLKATPGRTHDPVRPMFLSASENMLPPHPSTLGTPPFPPFAPVQEPPLVPARAQTRGQKRPKAAKSGQKWPRVANLGSLSTFPVLPSRGRDGNRVESVLTGVRARARRWCQNATKRDKTRQITTNRDMGCLVAAHWTDSGPILDRFWTDSPAGAWFAWHGWQENEDSQNRAILCQNLPRPDVSLRSGRLHFPRRFKFGCSLVRSGAFRWSPI